MFGRRAAFWVAVGVTGGILAPFAMNLAADKIPALGLRRLRNYLYSPGSGAA